MSEIFKTLCQDETTERVFGIRDDRPHKRAYVDTNFDNNQIWAATVINKSGRTVTFTALDNCIEFRTSENKMESRCEGVLTYGNTIIFIEAKSSAQNAKVWAGEAIDQLIASINAVSARVTINSFMNKRAAICNRLRTKNREKHTERIKAFKNATGYILEVDHIIRIE